MRIHVLSDLHLSRGPLAVPSTDADLVVLAGDLARPAEAVAWARGLRKPALYVPGNHEFYGGSIEGTLRELRERCAGTEVTLLDDDEIVLGGVRFLGSTLWTDFMLDGDGERRAASIAEAQRSVRDFSRIRVDDAGDALFTPAHAAARFAVHAAWLEARLARGHAGPTVVVTHHAPSRRSIHPRFAGSPLNAAFVSDAERLAGGGRACLWIHGHLHDSFDYDLRGTRVLCNPRGYATDGVNENAWFDPGLTVDVG
ncbi:MAG: metallophosphoesterase [Betaproteobacteria bacterium]